MSHMQIYCIWKCVLKLRVSLVVVRLRRFVFWLKVSNARDVFHSVCDFFASFFQFALCVSFFFSHFCSSSSVFLPSLSLFCLKAFASKFKFIIIYRYHIPDKIMKVMLFASLALCLSFIFTSDGFVVSQPDFPTSLW